ncbi:MAG: hypothetical protein HY053_01145 [Proteobacteria bacterium]|nr:hypothetical protein [Pseudomonadota bacterium]
MFAQAVCDGTPPQRLNQKQSLALDSIRQKILEDVFTNEADRVWTRASKKITDPQIGNMLQAQLQEIGQRCFIEALRNIALESEQFFDEDELKIIVHVRKLDNRLSLTAEEQELLNEYNGSPLADKAKEFASEVQPKKKEALELMDNEFNEKFRVLVPELPGDSEEKEPAVRSP